MFLAVCERVHISRGNLHAVAVCANTKLRLVERAVLKRSASTVAITATAEGRYTSGRLAISRNDAPSTVYYATDDKCRGRVWARERAEKRSAVSEARNV